MPRTTVSETSWEEENDDGEIIERTQYKVTVPKAFAEAMDLGGATVEWDIESGSTLSFSKVED